MVPWRLILPPLFHFLFLFSRSYHKFTALISSSPSKINQALATSLMAIKLPNVDHYKILGLPSGEELKNLTIEDIKKAYKRKALELHPDKRPDDPHANAKFQKLQFSKDVLLDQFNRKKIDAKFSEQFRQSSAKKPESEQAERDWRDPDWDSDPGAEERRRNAWREFLKNHPYRVRDLHMRRHFWRKFL